MKLKYLLYITFVLCVSIIVSCAHQEEQPATTGKNWSSDSSTYTDVNDVQTVLPQAGNVELIEMNCVPCHSLRYIEMQPKLSYKTWEKIVDKMVHSYGAPVRDSITRKDIINYLYAIKGTDEHK